MASSSSEAFDVCIIGAGPGGLAALSACVEPYSLDQLNSHQGYRAAYALRDHKPPRICVVDPQPWLSTWRQRFQSLGIEWLRSPTMAHPDLFHASALLEFAVAQNRTDELMDSECVNKKIRGLHEASSGQWRLPSSALFLDFCEDLVSRCPHELVEGSATSVDGVDGDFVISLENGHEIKAGAVVLALGVPGPPVIPPCIADLPSKLMFHSDFHSGARLQDLGVNWSRQRVLVLGGGLTAVQVALLAVDKGCKVTLCSRRPLTTRHFDIAVGWFDKREAPRHHFEFLSKPVEDRFQMVKETRGGGSVPPFYMQQIHRAQSSRKLEIVTSTIEVEAVFENHVDLRLDGQVQSFDRVVSACGHRPDCTSLPVIQGLMKHSPVQIVGGLPQVTQDLQWGSYKRLFVVGALASLQVGPDAGNLMGLRRAAQTVALTMDLRAWLRKETNLKGNIRGNMFALLGDTDSEAETETEVDEHTDSEWETSDNTDARSSRSNSEGS